uniref:Tubulin-specific chaperone A n=1 Tax=Palpitomonas bilix TaxID=652834 RepID=A0A7S3GJJ0_9EUKA|mmetsp:Transcript_6326/g.15537  ORF Transcript_6326/g.15537 Transcript_6326/m.15537 type:complete len:109 (+) Transcript_6326:62-388(+)|eukprot:CAMPEP_0113907098 /NCGR_PEP_ID=MMETSP0780_2-20120614/25243_1 /TAXON_ID=652834 /ORGANISM="Palpitomonas bilix" /LENGTH=108 /DNA_ID=CAMNT_0000902029 /DNA_START=62 /DNA_END=388 /DNA_ORIENTATION=+ /assembly_acc=CAM_ASM_000599
MADALRAIKIQTKACQRYKKEIAYYKKEEEQQRSKIAKLQESGADGHDIDKQKEVLEETLQMIPECKNLLEQAVHELESLVAQHSDDEKIKESEELTAANELLEELRA